MPNLALLILGPAFGAEESARSLANLKRVDLPHATKLVVTRGKFDADGAAKTFNIDSGYPAEIAELQTLATSSGHRFRDDPRFRDGYDLFCIRRLLERQSGFDLLLLLRDPNGLEQCWPEMLARASGGLFAVDPDNGRNLLLNLANPRCREMLELAWTLYRSGAAFAMQPYGLAAAMAAARDALDLVTSLQPATAG